MLAKLTNQDLLQMLEDLIKCAHYCPTDCDVCSGDFKTHYPFTKSEVQEEILVRMRVE